MRIADTRRVSMIGAGMSGTLLALLLARRGFEVDLFERGDDPRGKDSSEPPHGPHILALGERGRAALRDVGLEQAVGEHVTSMRGRMIHDRAGQTREQPYGIHDFEALYAIRSRRLIRCLLDAAEATGRVKLRFGARLQGIDWDSRTLAFEDGGNARFEVLFGADGARSQVRRSIAEATGMRIEEDLLDTGYKHLHIATGTNGMPQLDTGHLHVWPRGGYLMIAMPDTDGSFAAMLFLPRKGDHRMPWGFADLDSWIRQKAFMEFNFPDAATLLPDLEQQFSRHPVGLLGTVRCSRWHHDGLALLVGDAAHTIVPFHGQGVNAAFEDCSGLMDLVEGGADDWSSLFRQYEESRRADTEAITEMALEAYRTMRQSMRHRDFLLRKALERELEQRHPGVFVPRYSLVMFHRIPYAEACRRGHVQAGILDDLLKGRHQLVDVDFAHADRLVDERLTAL